MNFKRLPYTTTRLEYPEFNTTLAPLGLEPHNPEHSSVKYTCPTVKISDGTYIMDSAKIAPVLEQLQPEPSLLLKGPHDRVHKVVGQMMGSLVPTFLYRVRDGLNPASAEYYEAKFKPLFGIGLDELAESELARNSWTNAEPSIHEMGEILGEQPGGPYVLGSVVSYADFVFAAVLHCILLLDTSILEKLFAYDTAFKTHHEACKLWFERAEY